MPTYSRNWAVFLDFDGTLVEIAEHPGAVVVSPALPTVLQGLYEVCGGAVALISGRSIADLERLFPSLRIAMAGQHGAEWRDAAGNLHHRVSSAEPLAMCKLRLNRLMKEHPGLVLEDKGLSLALHYRQAPHLEAFAAREVDDVARQLGSAFQLQRGKMVFEIKPSGMDKGGSIATMMAIPPFQGRIPVFIGDDLTDEHGFRVVNEQGGHSIKVGPEPTKASFRLPDSETVCQWLSHYIAWAT